MDTFRKDLNAECDYRMKDETMDRFLGLMTEVHLKNNESLIPYGKFDDNIYIVKSGIVRHVYFDGQKEKTFAFAAPGTMIISWNSFYKRIPSFFQLESCGPAVVMKISKSDFDALTEQSNDFKTWMLRLLICQHWCFEMKLDVLNGTAKERFESLVRNRPEIMENVRLGVIASYLGITHSYLSRLKKSLKQNSGS